MRGLSPIVSTEPSPEPGPSPESPPARQPDDVCEICGSSNLAEIRCKTICLNCHTILKTCSDL